MVNVTDILCDAVQDSYADGFLVKVYGVQCIVSFPAIPPTIIVCIAMRRARALHQNIRLLLMNFFIAAMLANGGMIIVGVYHLWAVVASQSNDQLCEAVAMTGRFCTRLQTMNSFGSFSLATSLVFLAIERIYATVYYKTYENRGYRKLGVRLAILQWIMSIPALPFLGDVDTRYPYCQSAVVRPRASQAFLACMLIAEITGLVAFAILVFVNRQKTKRYFFNSALKLLSARYQLRENVNTTKLMIPVSISSCFLFATCLLTVIILLDDLPDNAILTTAIAQKIISFARWREMVGFCIPIHTFTLCTVVVCYSDHVRQATMKLVGCNRNTATSKRRKTNPNTGSAEIGAEQIKERYFDALKKQWELTGTSHRSEVQYFARHEKKLNKSLGSRRSTRNTRVIEL